MHDLHEISKVITSSDVQINVRKLPSYLSWVSKENRDVIFIHRMVQSKQEILVNNIVNESETSFDGNITGTPLEVPTSKFETMNLTGFDECIEDREANHHYPLKILKARSILNHCALNAKPSLPVFILTDGIDPRKTAVMYLELKNGWIARGWVADKGYIDDPSLKDLLADHAKLTKCPPNQVTCEARCSYLIKKTMLLTYPSQFQSLITLHASWKKISFRPPIDDQSTEIWLDVKLRVGNESGGLKVLWEQICLLDKYLKIIAARTEGRFTERVLSLPTCEAVLDALGRKVNDVSPLRRIQDIKMEPLETALEENSKTDLDQLIKLYTLNEGPVVSLTDRLWTLFIECQTYDELSSCLEELYIFINKKKSPVPFLSSSNITRLGSFLLGNSGVGFHDPLPTVVELGIEKLKKEILLIFTKAKIAVGLNVPQFPSFTEISKVDWLSVARKWHLWLCRAYCALEIFWNIQQALALPNEALCYISPQILQVFTGENSKIENFESVLDDPLQEVRSPIQVKYVENKINMATEDWVLSLKTSNNLRECRSVYYKTADNIFPNVSHTIDEIDCSFGTNAFNHHWYEFKSISDKCSP